MTAASASQKEASQRKQNTQSFILSILKIQAFREIKTEKAFFFWVLERLRSHSRLRRRLVFPEVNIGHSPKIEQTEHDSNQDGTTGWAEWGNLEKFSGWEEAHKMSQIKIKRLNDDIMKLKASSISWCMKFHELLGDREDSAHLVDFSTPKKRVKTNLNEEFFSL